MINKKSVLPLVLLFTGVMFISFSFYFYQVFFSANLQVDREETYIEIPRGMSFKTLIDDLTRQGVINNYLSFAFVSKVLGYQDKVKAGRYLIEGDMNNLDAVHKLESGKQSPVMVTFNNVRTKRDLAEKLDKYLALSEDEIIEALSNPELCKKVGKDTFSITNIFLPNSYEMYWDITAEQLFERMKKEYDKFWNDQRKSKASKLGMTPDQVSILASIVQSETRLDDEKPRISGVYYNRLKMGMALQADPTLVFAHGDFTLKRVLNGHKEINSPYNTYMYPGLPPGPIAIPSIASIDAVLNTEEHKYLFFCAREDFSGYHNFSTNIRDHVNNARRYQKALNKANIQ